MKTHTIIVKDEDMKGSKYETKEWAKRVDIVKWEWICGVEYRITIRIK